MITPALIKQRLPEFAAVDDSVIQFWLDTCATELNADTWGARFDEGHQFLTAHSMVRGGVLNGGAAGSVPTGPLASVAVGKVSKSFAVAAAGGAGGADDLDLTSYGQIFKRKARGLMKTPFVV